jgi:tRNA C32,U32 (ribose-2'-O)-methylase TrmJ
MLKSVSTSKQEIEDAKRHLSKVLQDLGAAPRAQKTTISGVVQTAFDRLRSARESLDKLEKLIKGSS